MQRFAMPQWMLVGRLGVSGEECNKLIDPVPYRVGRRPDAALTLSRASISSLHAELTTNDDRLYLRDLGSTNGTFVNGERITEIVELKAGDAIQFADVSLRVAVASTNRALNTVPHDCCDQALARVQFDKLLRDEVVTPYFQPIVDLQSGAIQAFEVLARSRLIGLETPSRMFGVACDLHMESRLSDLMRRKGVEISEKFHETPTIYLNTHPAEFEHGANWNWVRQLREMAPSQKLVIEIQEKAATDVVSIAQFHDVLRDYDIGLAFDDFGAGQARISEPGRHPSGLPEVRPRPDHSTGSSRHFETALRPRFG